MNDTARDPRFARKFDTKTQFETRSILCAPLISRGHTIGVVEIINKLKGRFVQADLDVLLTLVEPCAIAIENAILFQRTEQLTITDDLTKLFNSRYLNVYLGREIKRCKRHGIPLSVIFLDLDGFKGINDAYGHLAGSGTLAEVGAILAEAVRESDILARYGGDEFVVVLPETPPAGALVIAERLRARHRGPRLPAGPGPDRAHLRQLRHRELPRPRAHSRGPHPEGGPGHVPGEGEGQERDRGGGLVSRGSTRSRGLGRSVVRRALGPDLPANSTRRRESAFIKTSRPSHDLTPLAAIAGLERDTSPSPLKGQKDS